MWHIACLAAVLRMTCMIYMLLRKLTPGCSWGWCIPFWHACLDLGHQFSVCMEQLTC